MDEKASSRYSVSVTRASSYMSWVGTRAQTSLTRTSFEVKTSLKRTAPKVKPFWLSSQRQACIDFRARAGRGCLWVLAVLWVCGLTTGFALLCVWSQFESSGSARANSGSACLPDDSFSLRPDLYRYWSNSGFFQITLGVGELTFTQAKAIDVIWDIVVGRGGQGLLAYLSWQTFVRYVTTSMEVQPVTFNTYRTVFLQNESLVLGIPRIIRDFCRRRSLHSRFAMVFIVLTMVFILIFPTLGGSMTGYSGNVKAYVLDSGENFVPFSDFQIAVYTIHDGSRIGQTDEFQATIYGNSREGDDPSLLDLIDWSGNFASLDVDRWGCGYQYRDSNGGCNSQMMLANISLYISIYGTEPQYDTQSRFGNISLPSPTLGITVHDTPSQLNRTKNSYDRGYNGSTAMFLSGNQTYSQNYIESNAQCQAQKTYQWGFSFIQLALMLMLLLLWTTGILTMYITSKLARLRRGNYTQIAGEYKAVFELADAMHTQLLSLEKDESIHSGGDVRRNTSEREIRKRIETQLRGGEISYGEGDAGLPRRRGKAEAVEDGLLSSGTTETEKDGEKEEGRAEWTFKAWARREIWWLLALAAALVVEGVVVAQLVQQQLSTSPGVWVVPALPLAILFAMYVGLTHASRGMVLFWAVLVVSVLPGVVLGVVLLAFTSSRT